MTGALALLPLLLAAGPAELEAKVARHVTGEFERIGRSAPTADPALSGAARKLAQEALAGTASDAADLFTLTSAVSDAGGYDPSPRALIVRGAPAEEPLRSFLARGDLAEEPATHVGVGAAVGGGSAALVVLLAHRKLDLAPFPRAFPKPGATRALCVELTPSHPSAEVYVTRPGGQVDKLPARAEGGRSCARVTFPDAGRHTVELIAKGERGPEVVALFFVQVGSGGARGARERHAEPTSVEESRAAILSRINALRKSSELAALAADARLDEIAQAYSDRMAEEGFFSHVAPDGADLRSRLTRAGYVYRHAGENLGMAGGPLAAHFGIEHSPGHRRNLLDPGYRRVGIGVSLRRLADRTQVIVTEILASLPEAGAGPLEQAYRAIDERRKALGLPPLERSPVLERIAREHAEKALALDEPRTQLPGVKLHERVFAAMAEVGGAAVDLFVSDDPALITDSKNLAEPRNDRIGLAAVKGDSPRFGNGKFWVVVIYASGR